MAGSRFHPGLVAFTLAGEYDEDKPVLIDADDASRSISLRIAKDLVSSLTGAFAKDSTVCLHLANDILYPILVLAILNSGAQWTGTNPAYTVSELEQHFKVSETSYVVVADDQRDPVEKAAKSSPKDIRIVRFCDLLGFQRKESVVDLDDHNATSPLTHEHAQSLADLMDSQRWTNVSEDLHNKSAVLMQTSGTTGLPKIAVRTHKALMIEAEADMDSSESKDYTIRRLWCTPIFHGFTFPEVVINALRSGTPTYIMKRYDSSFASKVKQFGITETFAAPPMLQMLVNDPSYHEALQSLRNIYFGGAPLVDELFKSTRAVFKKAPHITPVYGMTEGGWFTTLKWPETDDRGSVGRVLPSLEARVDQSAAHDLNTEHEIGEILVRGPQIMTGYLGNEDATAAAFAEGGWLRTGDLGYILEGKIYLVGRSKDLIKTNGWTISPTELENAALTCSGILDAAAFGAGHGVDEHPVLCIVRNSERSDVAVDKLRSVLRERLAAYKVSKCEVHFVSSIPKSAAGKILRKQLRDSLGFLTA